MNINTLSKLGAAVILTGTFSALCARAGLVPVTNVSSQANTFECFLTATQVNVTIGTNNNVQAWIYMDSAPGAAPVVTTNGIPIPVMNLKVGQMIICHFTNNLPAGMDSYASIHWHGIELDNDSDGTGVTQDAVRPGQNYTYQFQTFRPGLFWFHNHMDPGTSTFRGMYGVMIIPNGSEPSLVSSKVLPTSQYTYPLALSDINFNPATGFVGQFYGSTNVNFGTNVWASINALAAQCHNNNDSTACAAAGNPAPIVLVNGFPPNTNVANLTPIYTIPSGQRVRLQIMNEAISRDFRLTLLNPAGAPNSDTNLYRIGGQGGLLNNMRLEGGILGTNTGAAVTNNYNTLYNKGEIVVGSGERVDVIIYPTSTNNGDIIKLVGNPLPVPYRLSQNLPANYPIAYFKIQGSTTNYAQPHDGDPLLTGSAQVENLKTLTNLATLTDPATLGLNPLGKPYVGSTNPKMVLNNSLGGNNGQAGIDNIDSHALDGNLGNGAYASFTITNTASTRYARVGDLLELSVNNGTGPGSVHPYHLHGFSMQPVKMMNANGTTAFTYNYPEFVDTLEVLPGMTYVFRVRLDYRPKFCDLSPNSQANGGPILVPCTNNVGGGAVGRWLMHCHIFLHAGVGMIGELVVMDPLQQTNVVQLPSLTTNGLDVLATTNSNSKTVANGFVSTNGTYITGITVWGSWNNDQADTNATFELKFWTGTPQLGAAAPRPGWQAWEQMFAPGNYQGTLVATNPGPDLFFDPSQPSNFTFSDTNIWRYDFIVPLGQAFLPNPTNTYWLSVSAYSSNWFGWKSSVTNNNFTAAANWSGTTYGPNWAVLNYPTASPYSGTPINTSFMLTSPGPGVTPASPVPGIITPPSLPPALSTSVSNGNLSISWSGGGVLQYADSPEGPWTTIDGATSPYVAPTDAPQRFYRVAQQ
jgi:FtsP/CotA-like multicopper oxidase with cupredoxin domain